MSKRAVRSQVFSLVAMAGVLGCYAHIALAQPAGSQPSIGWALQSVARAVETDPNMRGRDTSISRMLSAYRRGVPFYVEPDGAASLYAVKFGIAAEDWPRKRAEPALEDIPLVKDPPFVNVVRDERLNMDSCTLAPIKVADDLWVSITMSVISKDAANPALPGRDFLVAQVEIHGGEFGRLATSPHIDRGTLVDFWNAHGEQRITVDEWRPQDPAGHISTDIYGPLLYRVLDSEPEYLLIGDRKISLPRRFRAGCKELCRKVSELRIADDQPERPRFRGPNGE